MIRSFFAILIATLVAPSLRAAPAAERGLTENVVCTAEPAERYALYVPTSYDPARKWPIVYALDARSGAMDPMASFRAAAEEFGVIVASSWNSASDGPIEPNFAAMRAMWNDTHARLSIDDHQVFVAGFSGTVRSSIVLANLVPGSIAAIIGSGAGFPPDTSPSKSTSFVFFGTVGIRDFNFSELQELDRKLGEAGVPHRIEEFDGRHEWMPAPLAREALGWTLAQMMRRGVRPRDDGFLDARWNEDSARASSLPPVEAQRLWTGMVRDYEGLRDTSTAAARAAGIAGSKEFKKAAAARERELEEESNYTAEAQRVLATERWPKRAIGDLRIEQLRKRNDPAAARMLNALSGQTGFYLPREMEERKDFVRAAFFLTIAAAIHPESYRLAYALAAAQAQAGARSDALESLRRAVSLGFHDRAHLESDSDFTALRNDPAMQEIVRGLH